MTYTKPIGYRRVLSVDSDAKTIKGRKRKYLTGILYLAPADESGVLNVCPKSTPGCRAGCLFRSGLASVFPSIIQARIDKTRFLAVDPDNFKACLRYDIVQLVERAAREKLIPCVRINGTSDLWKLAKQMALEFPEVQFYDYTKLPKPWQRQLPNYALTFSRSENNEADCLAALEHGVNVSVVFQVKRGRSLPQTWHGYRVIDGDLHDLRFLDPKGVVVGLRAKGPAKHDTSGFVQIIPAA
jgi:hypothetical protein